MEMRGEDQIAANTTGHVLRAERILWLTRRRMNGTAMKNANMRNSRNESRRWIRFELLREEIGVIDSLRASVMSFWN